MTSTNLFTGSYGLSVGRLVFRDAKRRGSYGLSVGRLVFRDAKRSGDSVLFGYCKPVSIRAILSRVRSEPIRHLCFTQKSSQLFVGLRQLRVAAVVVGLSLLTPVILPVAASADVNKNLRGPLPNRNRALRYSRHLARRTPRRDSSWTPAAYLHDEIWRDGHCAFGTHPVVGDLDSARSDDVLHQMLGRDTIDGGAGNDYITGQSSGDTIRGGTGNDTLWGGGGPDVMSGDAGNDFLAGQADNDTLFGGDGQDQLSGQDGHDRLYGQNHRDIIWGNSGNDALVGGPGEDALMGGPGRDTGLRHWFWPVARMQCRL